MTAVSIELRNIPGTAAALGWAGAHTVVGDRPDGKAAGQGLGFNGVQLLALAIGGCFCNDLRYAADELGIDVAAISVSVTLEMDGTPLLATSATLSVSCNTADGTLADRVIARASEITMVTNSVRRGFPIEIQTQ
jgi:organic hydroperoxide reductase OsmC/OhrA